MLESAKKGENPLKVELWGKPANSSTPIVVLSSGVFAPTAPNGQANTNAEGITAVLSQLPIDVASPISFEDASITTLKTNLAVSPAAALIPPSSQRAFDIRQQGNYKIGFFGMVGMDWDVHSNKKKRVLNHGPDDLPDEHKEFLVSEAKTSARVLRREYGVDIVVAVTNMRLAEDLLLSSATQAKGLDRVDFIFGGYDREGEGNVHPKIVMRSQNRDGKSKGEVSGGWIEVTSPEIRVVKSGAAWEGLSVVEMCVIKEGEEVPELSSVKVTQFHRLKRYPPFASLAPSVRILKTIDTVTPALANLTAQPLFVSHTAINGKEAAVRHSETNLGNFIADSMMAYYDADIALFPSGSIRCGHILGSDSEKQRQFEVVGADIIDCLPFQNRIVLKLVTGQAIKAALENSVSNRHADGRFLQLGGLRLNASRSRPEGERIVSARWVLQEHANGTRIEEDIRDEEYYTVAMTEWLANGWGGFSMLRKGQLLRGGETPGMTDTDLFFKTFGEWSEVDNVFISMITENRKKKQTPAVLKEYLDNPYLSSQNSSLRAVRYKMVLGKDGEKGVPIVSPETDGRIHFHKERNLEVLAEKTSPR
ncbi:5'-nucleotidase [Triangularia setosa]|uniref:5'-nucleotidase n=1 Tax=Triangularia setosa TaxID=2587417 RepID=A0AAN6W5D5_9PEZI|nr:5'-nucleotidase [Podospora setosa]